MVPGKKATIKSKTWGKKSKIYYTAISHLQLQNLQRPRTRKPSSSLAVQQYWRANGAWVRWWQRIGITWRLCCFLGQHSWSQMRSSLRTSRPSSQITESSPVMALACQMWRKLSGGCSRLKVTVCRRNSRRARLFRWWVWCVAGQADNVCQIDRNRHRRFIPRIAQC